ncbi:5-oxoproline transporter, DUF969 family subunit [Dyella sp.]|jgi:uncharacterized membrane protein|uniref:5-oxoproline transporter, DUF969 family subunit n=1 Tax=Dyella sp. TaxID=1869338 RepID=UPI002D794D58|nr:DUF969 family protein [Dyella sp.]HET6432591.1 DUF969 family protein [Dyella sp.]
MNYWPLLGVAVIALGFVLRFNPVLVVVVAALVSGVLSGMRVPELLALLGTSFASSRILLIIILTLPAIGLLERAGLREHAQQWMARMRGMTLARLLIGYLLGRQLLSMIGLQSVAGPAQTVRPLLAPMAEAAAARIDPALPEDERDRLRALAAATDNVGLFFGEDVFIALGAVLLIQGFYDQHGIALTPLSIALWALPTAIAAFVIHSARIVLYQRGLRRRRAARAED